MIDGKRIAERRKAMGLTQEELADELGVSNRAVSTWERSVKTPRDAMLLSLAERLGVTIAYLMGLEDNRAEEPVHIPPKEENKNAELVHQMAEVYLAYVRELRTENAELKSENESLRQIVRELREASDTFIEGGKKNA